MIGSATRVAATAIALALCGCSTPLKYEWGAYQDSVFNLTEREGQIDVDGWIDSLEQTVEKARASDRPIPPGMHAHLGLLYSMRGDLDTALAALESEKELYPESAVFVDGIRQRMQGAKQ